MGLDYEANVHVGFCYDIDDFDKFKITKPQVNHVEKRYDAKSGKRIKDEIVIDSEEHEVYVFDKIEYRIFFFLGECYIHQLFKQFVYLFAYSFIGYFQRRTNGF